MNINIGQPTIAQYNITVRAQTRDYWVKCGCMTFNVIDPLEFCTALWNKSIEYIHRGVKFGNDSIAMSCLSLKSKLL